MTHNFTSEDNGKTIEINKGDNISITLDGFGAVLYRYDDAEYNKDLIKLTEHKNTPPEVQMPGAGGKDNWEFNTIQAGIAKISISTYELSEDPTIRTKNRETAFEINLSIK